MSGKRKTFFLMCIFVLFVTLPYVYAAWSGGDRYIFNGLLINPLDGNTYLAKMYQGWSGSWRFVLPYTPEHGEGAYIYLYYLFLGHLSRWLGIPLIWMFHIARLINSLFLLFVLKVFYDKCLGFNPTLAWRAFLLSVIGSGFGWIAFIFGLFTSDFWVSEAFPFLSAYTNPHFPLGLALMLLVFILWDEKGRWLSLLKGIEIGLLSGLITPFGFVVVVVVLSLMLAWEWFENRSLLWHTLTGFVIGGLPLVGYEYYVMLTDPVFAEWNRQNLTLAPPVWDTLISFSPALIFAIAGLLFLWKQKENKSVRILIGWLMIGLIAMYIPFNLQRRFVMGLYIPTAGLAVVGVSELVKFMNLKRQWLWTVLLLLSIPTNIIVLLSGFYGVQTHASEYYITQSEANALDWIKTNTPPDALILASPEMGNLIPAYTGRRVLYGHPFETVHANTEFKVVTGFFKGGWNGDESMRLLKDNNIDYVFYGPRERALGTVDFPTSFQPGFLEQDVSVLVVVKDR